MRYIPGMPNNEQLLYIKLIQKLDPNIDPTSITSGIPDYDDLEKEYIKEINNAKNNFERVKISRELDLRKLVWEKLIQIQFKLFDFGSPIYFEIIPMQITSGSLLEYTLTTIIHKQIPPIFFGKTISHRLRHLFITSPVKMDSNIFEKTFDLNDFQFHGKFEIGFILSLFRHDIGEKILRMEAENIDLYFNDLTNQLNNQGLILKRLQKLFYLSNRKIRPADSPKSVSVIGHLVSECMGCIVPITDEYMVVQIGDFNPLHKSHAFLLLKQLLQFLI